MKKYNWIIRLGYFIAGIACLASVICTYNQIVSLQTTLLWIGIISLIMTNLYKNRKDKK